MAAGPSDAIHSLAEMWCVTHAHPCGWTPLTKCTAVRYAIIYWIVALYMLMYACSGLYMGVKVCLAQSPCPLVADPATAIGDR